MKKENGKEKSVTITIDQITYGQLEREARKRELPPGEYLEILIEMDYISNAGEDPEEGAEVSISKKHYDLLREEAKDVGFNAEETAEMIIGLSAEMLPERPLSREKFDAVAEAWGGVDFPGEGKRNAARRRGGPSEEPSS